ncbi:MAG TPA: diguanylate cyclase [Steroidobacteraceae bacterium]|nr:diguanylate cyclase [Steroidobacteraceae bacterium]
MPGSGGHTTVIQRVLERRGRTPPTSDEGTTATVAVMVRVLPPPKALLAFQEAPMRAFIEQRVRPDMLDFESVADEAEALRLFEAEFRPVVLTDSPEVIRRIRARSAKRAPYILFIAEIDDSAEREAGLAAGADDCVGRRVSEREFEARVAAAKRIAELEAVLRITLAENRKLSATDDLTKVASRRFFGKHFPREVERAARYGRALSLILCDIDNFKKINDTLGHAAGDDILKQFGPRVQRQLRKGVDWVARIGGEEFAIVMPETAYEAAVAVARKLRAAVGGAAFKASNKSLQVTASFGVCGMDKVPLGESRLAERVLKIADAALYRSKNDGRNRVTAAILKGPAS